MALVNTEFERQEEHGDRSLGISADLDVIVLGEEGIGSLGCAVFTSLLRGKHRFLVLSILGGVGNFTSSLSFSASSTLDLLSGELFGTSGSLVEDLDVEEDILRESILNDQIDLLRLVKLSGLGEDLN